MTLEGPRVMGKLLARGTVTNSGGGGGGSVTSSVVGADWDKLSDTCYIQRAYYDLSGYNLDFLTTFFQGIDVQESFGVFGDMQGYLIEIISTERLDNSSITGAAIEDPARTLDLPGFPLSTFDQSQIVYARLRSYVTSTTWGKVGLFSQSMWGTCQAATADKVHITRIWYCDPALAPNAVANLPPCNVVSGILVAKEEELPFLMRQKRSYELAT